MRGGGRRRAGAVGAVDHGPSYNGGTRMSPPNRPSTPLSAADRLFVEFQSAVAGRYSIEQELGRGGMGVVYLAREVRLDRPVALKLLPPRLAAQPGPRERFLREARLAAKLSHPTSSRSTRSMKPRATS